MTHRPISVVHEVVTGNAQTLLVGEGRPYTTIADAVTAAEALVRSASSPAVISVAPGVYAEDVLIKEDWIHLIGEGAAIQVLIKSVTVTNSDNPSLSLTVRTKGVGYGRPDGNILSNFSITQGANSLVIKGSSDETIGRSAGIMVYNVTGAPNVDTFCRVDLVEHIYIRGPLALEAFAFRACGYVDLSEVTVDNVDLEYYLSDPAPEIGNQGAFLGGSYYAVYAMGEVVLLDQQYYSTGIYWSGAWRSQQVINADFLYVEATSTIRAGFIDTASAASGATLTIRGGVVLTKAGAGTIVRAVEGINETILTDNARAFRVGPYSEHTTVQSAVNAAQGAFGKAGADDLTPETPAVILISAGNYLEDVVVREPHIHLYGQGPELTYVRSIGFTNASVSAYATWSADALAPGSRNVATLGLTADPTVNGADGNYVVGMCLGQSIDGAYDLPGYPYYYSLQFVGVPESPSNFNPDYQFQVRDCLILRTSRGILGYLANAIQVTYSENFRAWEGWHAGRADFLNCNWVVLSDGRYQTVVGDMDPTADYDLPGWGANSWMQLFGSASVDAMTLFRRMTLHSSEFDGLQSPTIRNLSLTLGDPIGGSNFYGTKITGTLTLSGADTEAILQECDVTEFAFASGAVPANLSVYNDYGMTYYAVASNTTTGVMGQAANVYDMDASGGDKTLEISTADNAGREYFFRKSDSSANTVTVSVIGGGTINGAANYVLRAQYQFIRVVCDGTNAIIVGATPTQPSYADTGLTPGATAGDGSDTTLDISAIPAGAVSVVVNGAHMTVGDGVKTEECYFSADAGVTAKNISAIAAGDSLYWNGVIAGFELSGSDVVDVLYSIYTV